jgi:hypothetical protein
MFARSYNEDDLELAEQLAREVGNLAVALGNTELRSYSLEAQLSAKVEAGDFAAAREMLERRFELLAEINDPDHLSSAWESACDVYMMSGRMAEARHAVEQLEATVAGLTPHHLVHGLGLRLMLETAVGAWDVVRARAAQSEAAVEANLATPCPFNLRIRLQCALAYTHSGDESLARGFQDRAESLGMVGYGWATFGTYLQLARARGDLAELRRLAESRDDQWLTPSAYQRWPQYLDALTALGEREKVEAEAAPWLQREGYVTPFAVRALAVVRKDRALLADAEARFVAIGLPWHAEETRRLTLSL